MIDRKFISYTLDVLWRIPLLSISILCTTRSENDHIQLATQRVDFLHGCEFFFWFVKSEVTVDKMAEIESL